MYAQIQSKMESTKISRRYIVGCVCLFSTAVVMVHRYLITGDLIKSSYDVNSNQLLNKLDAKANDSVPFCSSLNRWSYIQDQCKRIANVTAVFPSTKRKPMLIADDERQVAFCIVPKIASSTLINAMALTTKKGLSGVKGSKRNWKTLEANYGLRAVPTLNIGNVSAYVKFLVLRHPFDRLLSAYYNKIADMGNKKKWNLKRRNMKKDFKTDPISFPEFAEAVLGGGHSDIHWNPYAHRCNVCEIEYDYVLRIENFARDFDTFLDHLAIAKNASTRSLRLRASSNEKSTSSSNIFKPKKLKEFGKLEPRYLKALTKLYQTDMALFGYGFNPNEFLTSCKISTTDGKECC